MEVILLSGILAPIAKILGIIMNGIYEFFHLFGVENIALSIFVFTVITKTLMLPLTFKQQKSSKLQAIIAPEIQKIQAKYKGKRDEVSMRKSQEETQAVYKKYGASPMSGCLPLLISMPIMFSLYRVINNIPVHVGLVGELYDLVAQGIQSHGSGTAVLADIVSNYDKLDLSSLDKITATLATFNTSQWTSLLGAGLSSVADSAINSIMRVNNFLGLSITNTPNWRSISIIIPVLSTALQFLQTKLMTVKTDNNDAPNPAASMNVVMPLMSGFFCLMLPIGVGIYWISNSLISIIQQFIINKHFDRIGLDKLVEQSKEKAKEKLYKNTVHESGGKIQDIARTKTKSIESISEKTKDTNNIDDFSGGKNDDVEDVSVNPTSISDIANILKNRNNEKGEK
ncbi:MAG: YidC/Oxa1 family membrane protein insertase [Clostridiales bacterium]|nr:YidC/Oxa1 family membrane protein insertase [Clostridiales bacterium]